MKNSPEYRRLHPRSIFYNCLRPEFLLDNDTTLCSDAFSAWDLSDDKVLFLFSVL